MSRFLITNDVVVEYPDHFEALVPGNEPGSFRVNVPDRLVRPGIRLAEILADALAEREFCLACTRVNVAFCADVLHHMRVASRV